MPQEKQKALPERHRPPYAGLNLPQRVLVWVFLGIGGWYLTWRSGTLNPHGLVISSILYACEIWFAASILAHLFMVWRLSIRSAPPPPPNYTVDVFVTTYNEPVSMLRRSLGAAVSMDYPHQTWLLDDGNRAEMKQLAQELNCHYIARTENIHAKAGNLNNGLKYSNAEFIAVFDADHIPNKHFLTKTLGYFQDETISFVQCPQSFYNLDSYQIRSSQSIRWGEQTLFFRVIQRGKDYLNATMFVGTTAVLRRAALDSIGGFATGTVTEDFHTTVRLQQKGWASVFHDEALAFGLAAPSLRSYTSQRLRWGQGGMQVLRKEKFFLGGGFSLPQRICNLASILTYFDSWPRLFLYVLPAIVLTTGISPINTLNIYFVAHFVPYYLLQFWVFEEAARGYGQSLYIEEYNLIRSFVFAAATLALFRKDLPFRVSKKHGETRMSEAILLLPQAIMLLWIFAGLGIGIWFQATHSHQLPPGTFWANIIWACLVIFLGIRAIGFTITRNQRRNEYRFPIPLPIKLELKDHSIYGVARDISSSGMGLELVGPMQLRRGEEYNGSIYLPDTILPFLGRVTHIDERDRQKIGITIPWEHGDTPLLLERFMYSSNIQWRINAITDHMRAPIEWLSDLFNHRKPIHLTGFLGRWEPLLSDAGTQPKVIGLISRAHSSNLGFTIIGPKMNEGERVRFWLPGDGGHWIIGNLSLMPEFADLTHEGLYIYRLNVLPESQGLQSSKTSNDADAEELDTDEVKKTRGTNSNASITSNQRGSDH